MPDWLDIVQCPECSGEMKLSGAVLACCSCGCSFEISDGCFFLVGGPEGDGSYAENYTEDYYNSPLYDYSSHRLNKILSLARPCEVRRVLDLGCGPGEAAVSCARAGADVYGVDVSRSALRLSSVRGRRHSADLHLFQFDGLRLPFKDGSFDAVVFSDVAEHIDDKTLHELMGEVARLLSPDGRAIIHTAPTKNIITFSKWLKAASLGRIDLHTGLVHPEYEYLHIRYHNRSSMRRHLSSVSLKSVIWCEFWYIQDQEVQRRFRRLGLGQVMADQLWCVAFKGSLAGGVKIRGREYLGLIDVPSDIEMDRVSELCLSYGFYGSEQDFRPTAKEAGMFINLPEGARSLVVEMASFRPGLEEAPVIVSLSISGKSLGQVAVKESGRHRYSADLPTGMEAGVAELKFKIKGAFKPCEIGMGNDQRELGVAIYSVKAI